MKCLTAWEREIPDKRQPLNKIASDFLQRYELSSEDKRFFWQLVTGCVRWLLLLDFHIKNHLKDKKSSLPYLVRNWLRVGAYQILFLDRIPPSAAVNETIKGLKRSKAIWASGMANAVLRKMAAVREKEGIEAARMIRADIKSPILRVAVETSHPEWMVKRWERRYGLEKTRNLCRANNSRPPLTLRTNTLRCTREELMALLRKGGFDPRPGKMSPEAVNLGIEQFSIADLPGYTEGLFQVQDESSQLASHLLAPRPGDKVLDLCAGLGGKTTHLAALMANQGTIVATDTNKRRLALLEENCSRLGAANVVIKDPKEALQEGPFDKVLVDAPCTGLGVIRRHPDIKWNRSPESIFRMPEIQKPLLVQAAKSVSQQGQIVYSVCSMEPEEGQNVIQNFLSDFAAWSIVPAGRILPRIDTGLFLELLPKEEGPDGFFAALLKKES